MQELFNICDEAFIKVLDLYEVKIIVAIGKFCEIRAQKALKQHCTSRNIQVKAIGRYSQPNKCLMSFL